MKGWLFFLAGVGCAIGVGMYLHGGARVEHVETGGANGQGAGATGQWVAETGTCRLTKEAQVATSYGAVTLPPGTALRYVGEAGGKVTVADGALTFTVTPDMVSGLTRAAEPAATEQEGDAAATPRGLLAGVEAMVMGVKDKLPLPGNAGAGFDFQKYGRFLVIADGSEGEASGSLVMYEGKARLVTNAHVLSEMPDARFSRLDSTAVATGPFSYAEGADLAVADQNASAEGMEMMTDVDKEVAVGDDVVVLGNSQGSDVVTMIPGKVTGIGPALVEVDAKFVQGNSGSPIIHVKTGKLIGIATFAQERRVDSLAKDSQFASGIRRFGYRLDTVRLWEHPSAWQFNAETVKTKAVRKKTEYLFYLGRDLSSGHVSLAKYEAADSPLRDVVTEYNSDANGLGLDGRETVLRLVRALSYETQADISQLHREDFTWYHWHEIEMDMQAREVMKKAFDQMLSVAQARLDNPFH